METDSSTQKVNRPPASTIPSDRPGPQPPTDDGCRRQPEAEILDVNRIGGHAQPVGDGLWPVAQHAGNDSAQPGHAVQDDNHPDVIREPATDARTFADRVGPRGHDEPDQGEDGQGQERDIKGEQPVVRRGEQQQHGVVEQVGHRTEPEHQTGDMTTPSDHHGRDGEWGGDQNDECGAAGGSLHGRGPVENPGDPRQPGDQQRDASEGRAEGNRKVGRIPCSPGSWVGSRDAGYPVDFSLHLCLDPRHGPSVSPSPSPSSLDDRGSGRQGRRSRCEADQWLDRDGTSDAQPSLINRAARPAP